MINKYLRILLFVVIFSLISLPAESNEHNFEFVVDVGSQTGVIMQDQDGFIWIGTQDGAVKYDGISIKRYSTENSQISNNMILDIYQDKEGLIWIGTTDGLNVYNKNTDSFKVYHHDSNVKQSISSSSLAVNFGASYIIEDSDGFIWIGTNNGLNRFDKKSNTFRVFRHSDNPGSLSNNSVSSLLEDSEGIIWVGTDVGINKFDKKTNRFTVYNEGNSQLSNNAISSIIEDSEGLIWVATKDGISRFDKSSESFQSYFHEPSNPNSLPFAKIDRLLDQGNGQIWLSSFVGKEKGLAVYNKKTGTFSIYHSNKNKPFSLSTDGICDIYKDNAGTIWLPSFSGPVDISHSGGHDFERYTHNPDNPNSILPDVITTMTEDADGLIWFASTSGIVSYDRKTKRFDNINEGYVAAGISYHHDGYIWFSGSNKLIKYDKSTKRNAKEYPMKPSSYANSLFEDKNDSNFVWMGTTTYGLALFNKEKESFTYYSHKPNDDLSIANNAIAIIYQDEQGFIWAPTLGGGLDVFDPKSRNVVRHYKHERNNPNSLSSNSINHLIRARDGVFWISTSKGLNRFEKETGKFKRFSKKLGFPANNIMTLLEDHNGILWIGSKIGLIKFDPKTEKSKLYSKRDGLPSNEFWEYKSLKAKNGSLWFGTPKGAFSFYPDQITENKFIPPVFITSLTQGGEDIPTGKALEKTLKINLDWKNNFFEMEFAALNYIHPEKNQYMYKLEGFDKDWYNTHSYNFGRYSGLPGGHYTLRIKGANNDRVWNERGASVEINVAVPWWKTRLFFVSIGCFVILFTVAIFLLRIKSIKTRNLELEKTVEERTIELQSTNDQLQLENKERLMAEEKAIVSESNYRGLFDNSTDAIFVHDVDTGIVLDCNRTMLEMYGFSKEEVLDASIDKFSARQPSYDQSDAIEWVRKAMKEGPQCFEWLAKRKDKTLFWGEVALKKALIGSEHRLLAFVSDISDRKKAEDQVKASLNEKVTLLQEIHHRVKNNMTVIASLLSLQANSTEDERLKKALTVSQNRVQSMSSIHEALYQSENLSSIEMNPYLLKLASAIAQNYGISSNVNITVESEDVLVSVKQASPLGLIVNELITNSFKYAFPENQEGEITIKLRKTEQSQIEVIYVDDGIGMPNDFDWHSAKSMGLKLVKMLAENQLGGSVEMERNKGTKFTIKFNIEA